MMTNDLDPLDSFLETITDSDPLDNFLDGIPEAKGAPKSEPPVKFIFQYGPDGCIKLSPARKAQLLAEQSARKKLTEDTGCTFNEWKELGYWIKSGSKSIFKSPLGEPLFTIEQVTPPRRY